MGALEHWRAAAWRRRRWLWPALVLAVAGFMFLHRLGEPRLVKSDEGLYAAAALELTRGANPLYPRSELAAYQNMQKPPGALWPAAISMGLLGKSKWSVRLPTALAGVLAVLLVYLIAATISRSRAGGAVAALLALCQGGWLELGRNIWLENTLTASFLLAIWLDHLARQRVVARQLLLLQIACGLVIGYSAWVKHLVGFAPLGAILLAGVAVQPELLWRPLRLLRRFGAILVSAVGFFGIWLALFFADRGLGEAMGQVQAKLAAEKRTPRGQHDVWIGLTRFVEPWVLVAGLVCLLALAVYFTRRPRRRQLWPSWNARAYLVYAVIGLALSHLVVFGTLADKLRAWYLIPTHPLFALGVGAVLGMWLRDREHALRSLALPVLAAGLALQFEAEARWYTWFAGVAAVLVLQAWIARWPAPPARWPLPGWLRARDLRPWFARGLAGVALLAVLGAGLQRASARVHKDPQQDWFAHYAALWAQDPPARLVVDRKNWVRPNYFKPLLYWYFSPLPMHPVEMTKPCDLSAVKTGEYALLHWTVYDCIAPRARQMRELTQWWRMVRIH